ncbi:MAG: RIP metalloprotease RseP [Deltaproteobacteria bacterium]|nr:RIP metalloprotease RseP [Deltaproteobacteria bacterium]
MSTNIFAFVVVLGILIFFHELGHFLVARLLGVGVEKFSLGFGPRLFGKKIGLTDYRISAIPLGGFVKMVGEDPTAEMDPEDIPISFTHKHVFKRILIVAAGPVFNLLLAVMIFYVIFQVSGTYILMPSIGGVQENSPAASAGLQAGDRITAIDGTPISSWEEMAVAITASAGRPIALTIQRPEWDIFTVSITPQAAMSKNLFGEDIERHLIGISSAGEVVNQRLNPIEALSESFRQTYNITKLTIVSIIKLIQGTVSAKTLGGPIMIAELAGQQAREGALNLVFFIALLSINLAIINFLPIPVLDGGHILFFLIEAIIRRPVNTRMREIAQQAGIFILIMLMIFVFYNDLSRIFSS